MVKHLKLKTALILGLHFCIVGVTFPELCAETLAQKAGIDVRASKASAKAKLKELLSVGLKYVPGGEVLGGVLGISEPIETKVDRIEERQVDALERIQQLSQKAISTKRKVEELYYAKQRSYQQGQALARDLKQLRVGRLLGAAFQEGLGIPLNPAAYVPRTPMTQLLRENLHWDLSLEQRLLGRSQRGLRGTRAALLETGGLAMSLEDFEAAYREAEAYELQLEEELEAHEQAKVCWLKEEVERIKGELKRLERMRDKPGLSVGEILHLEQLVENKRKTLLEMDARICTFTKKAVPLNQQQREKLAGYYIGQRAGRLERFFKEDEKRMEAKYGHLWRW